MVNLIISTVFKNKANLLISRASPG